MKMTALMILLVLQVVARPNAAAQVTLKEKATPLEKVLKLIKKQSAYGLVFDETLLRAKGKPVSIEVADMPVEQVLAEIFRHQDQLTYTLNGKIISVKERSQGKLPAAIKAAENSEDQQLITVKGVVRDESGNPAAGVSVMIKGTTRGTSTNERGEFSLNAVPENATLVFSSINMETYETNLNGRVEVTLVMKAKISQLQEVEITAVNTGYQTIPKERATGSFVHVDNALLNRSVSTNILDRINGVTSGVLFTPGLTPGTVSSDNKAAISIRGRSTIYSNPNPLIILDNFPYDGDLSTINPNDVESIDILKDAAAASIWGAYSGNGVIVITTKKGKLNQQMKVSVNANVTIGEKPNLWYEPRLNSSDYVSVEQYLFANNAYNSWFTSSTFISTALSPVADILNQQKSGLISANSANAKLDSLRGLDYRNDAYKYLYRKMVNQQYTINLSGGGAHNQYFFSFGFDNNLPNLQSNSYQRYTINASNTYSFFKDKMQLNAAINYTQSNTYNNNSSFGTPRPYYRLADDNGNALTVGTRYRQGYIDTAGQGKLLDWNYRPLDEMRLAYNNTVLTNYNINVGLKYKIFPGLDANLLYQYTNGASNNQNYNSQQTFFTRDLINSFTQLNYATGALTYKVPLGGIADFNNKSFSSQQFRAITSYNQTWGKGRHSINGIAGFEIKSYTSEARTYRLYGYDKDIQSSANMDFISVFPKIQPGATSALIPSNLSNLGTTNHFVSEFANVAYTYKSRYVFSASARVDGSNIFGATTNQKNVPLWSAGLKWNIDKETFYQIKWLTYLRLRVTDGYNANSNNGTSALLTEKYSNGNTQWGVRYAFVSNPPNSELRWEKTNILNIGLDFGLARNVLSGSIEYYQKTGTDILGNGPISPQTGISAFFGNIADMSGHGIDVTLNSNNIRGKSFQWSTNFLFSYATDQITSYKVKPSTIGSFINSNNPTTNIQYPVNPLEGGPVYAIYSYKWAGLDATGNPQFYFNGKASTDYNGLAASTDYANLNYNGPATPTYFGSLRNTFNWKQLTFSFNITYKLGYWFRNNYVTKSSGLLINGGGTGYQDYLNRWQKPGDESTTTVPVQIYPITNSNRDAMYASSDITALKGDNIRLQDIQFSYDLSKQQIKRLPFTNLRLYAYLSNLGIIWRANNKGIDPEASTFSLTPVFPNPRMYAFGMKIDF